MKNASRRARETIGLMPAAGVARRLAPLPCSKELFPVHVNVAGEQPVCRVACEHLLGAFRESGIQKAYVVLRKGKWDIPAYLGDGDAVGLHLSYLLMRQPFGVPFTLEQAYPFVKDARIALGFPDILFDPRTAFSRLLHDQTATEADVVLGLFPSRRPEQADVVELDEQGNVRAVFVKPDRTVLRYAWIIAVWSPVFTQFMHEHVQTVQAEAASGKKPELFLGDVLQAAVAAGLQVRGVPFDEGRYLDIGTPEALAVAVRGDWRGS